MKVLYALVGGVLSAQMWVRIEGYEVGAMLSVEHTCDGSDVPFTIQWGAAPPQTRAYVVHVYDPDAPVDTFTHWIVYNFTQTKLGPRMQGLLEGYNDFGKVGYGGPCPPAKDPAHRYVVAVYALRAPVSVASPVTWEKLQAALEGKVVARAETHVQYKRKSR